MDTSEQDPNQSKRLIWFFGPSGAGKRTLACDLSSQDNHPLKDRLGIPRDRRLCEESLTLNGSDRRDLLQIVPVLLQDTTCLLLKGQTDDFRHGVPKELRAALPHVQHVVVFLWAPADVLLLRLRNREGPKCRWDISKCAKELQLQVCHVEDLRIISGEVSCFDSSDRDYMPVDWRKLVQSATPAH